MLYQILRQKKKDQWSLILPIGGVVISLVFTYSSGDDFIDAVVGLFSKVGTFAVFLCFIGLIIAVACILLYFFDIKIGKSEEPEKNN